MKKQILKTIAGVMVLLTLLNSFCLNAFAESININGSGSGSSGGGANTSTSGTGYSLQSVTSFSGYRFTYMDYYGTWKGSVDIISSSCWSDYIGRKTCKHCGKSSGDGTNDSCVRFVREKDCPKCGEHVLAFICHTCK